MEKIDDRIDENVLGHMTRCKKCKYRYLSDVHWPNGTTKTYDCSYQGWGCAYDLQVPEESSVLKAVILKNFFGVSSQ